jgi:2-polyprenyl-6-methoxyphenol hydroxylase-like FAD-dependent oxidoreductase
MDNFRVADPATHAAIVGSFHHWDDIEIHFRGEVLRSGGHGFCGISRKQLLGILQERASELGVELKFQREIDDDGAFADADLVIGSDGANSRVRTRHAAVFEPSVEVRRCRYIWLGIARPFDAFTFAFEQTEHGWFQIHAYQFSAICRPSSSRPARRPGGRTAWTGAIPHNRSSSANACSHDTSAASGCRATRATCAAPPGSTSTAWHAAAGITAEWC